jgi:hypothetical protein
MTRNDPDDPLEHVEVVVNTPLGTWPTEGYLEVPVTNQIQDQLNHVAEVLEIPDVSGWEAHSGGTKLKASESYRQNGLRGRISISYGPAGSFSSTGGS